MRDPSPVPPAVLRLASALPDLATAGFFALLWLLPGLLPDGMLRTALLMMLVEFVLLHATAMLGGVVLERSGGDLRALLPKVAGLAALYLLFVGIWAYTFGAWWPFVALGWLLLGKLWLLLRPLPDDERRRRMYSDWVIATMAFVGAVGATALLPVPRLGLDPTVVAAAGLPGSGLWVSEPQTVVAAGCVYFALLAASRLYDWRLPGSAPPTHCPGDDPRAGNDGQAGRAP